MATSISLIITLGSSYYSCFLNKADVGPFIPAYIVMLFS